MAWDFSRDGPGASHSAPHSLSGQAQAGPVTLTLRTQGVPERNGNRASSCNVGLAASLWEHVLLSHGFYSSFGTEVLFPLGSSETGPFPPLVPRVSGSNQKGVFGKSETLVPSHLVAQPAVAQSSHPQRDTQMSQTQTASAFGMTVPMRKVCI